MSYQPHNAGTSQPPHNAGMNVPYNAGTPNQPPAPGISHPPQQPQKQIMVMSVTDMRAQIFANALVAFPHIVDLHIRKYPTSPLRSQDIFEVSVSLQHYVTGANYVARLTNRQSHAPALHSLVLGGAPQLTAQGALWHLLDTTCTILGSEQANIIERPPGTLAPIIQGTPEGDRVSEMERARASVTEQRETARAVREKAHAGKYSELKANIDAATLKRVQAQQPNPREGRQ